MKYFACFLLSQFSLYCQKWEWALNNLDGTLGKNIGSDKYGNIYITGEKSHFAGGGGSYYYPLFYKLDAFGRVLEKDTLGLSPTKAVTDTDGNTFIISSNKVLQINDKGEQSWSIVNSSAIFKNIALHPKGGIIAVGSTIGGEKSRSAVYHYDKYGKEVWHRNDDFASSGSNPNSVSCDKLGNVYLAGQDLRNDSVIGFLAKIDTNGNLISTKIIPDEPRDIVISNDLSIYVAGQFSTIPITINNETFQSEYKSAYLIKYDQQGQVLWHKILSDEGVTLEGKSLGVDGNNIFLTGSYTRFKVDSFSLNLSTGGALFLMKMDSAGNIAWIEHSTGISGTAYPKSIIVNSLHEILITGAVKETQAFGTHTLVGSTFPGLFVAKLDESNATTADQISNYTECISFGVFPNPVLDMVDVNCFLPERCDIIINIIDVLGQDVYTEIVPGKKGNNTANFDLTEYPNGVYFIEVMAGKNKSVKKIIKE